MHNTICGIKVNWVAPVKGHSIPRLQLLAALLLARLGMETIRPEPSK